MLGTDPGVTTQLFGGLGSDAVFVGGDANPVVTNDLLGHSGLIEHVVSSPDMTFNGLKVEGIVADIADNDEPFVRVIQTGGVDARSSRVRRMAWLRPVPGRAHATADQDSRHHRRRRRPGARGRGTRRPVGGARRRAPFVIRTFTIAGTQRHDDHDHRPRRSRTATA